MNRVIDHTHVGTMKNRIEFPGSGMIEHNGKNWTTDCWLPEKNTYSTPVDVTDDEAAAEIEFRQRRFKTRAPGFTSKHALAPAYRARLSNPHMGMRWPLNQFIQFSVRLEPPFFCRRPGPGCKCVEVVESRIMNPECGRPFFSDDEVVVESPVPHVEIEIIGADPTLDDRDARTFIGTRAQPFSGVIPAPLPSPLLRLVGSYLASYTLAYHEWISCVRETFVSSKSGPVCARARNTARRCKTLHGMYRSVPVRFHIESTQVVDDNFVILITLTDSDVNEFYSISDR